MTDWHRHDVNGIEVLERPGAGAALVLLHGIGSRAASFTSLLSELAPETRVIAWNAPGYGASRPLSEPWPEANDYAAALLGVFDALGLVEVTLVGHSLGTLTGAAFAARHRDRVARLVLASPALGHGVPRGAALSQAAQARIDDLERMGPVAFAKARAPRLVHAPQANPELVAQVTDGMSAVTMPGYGQAARMLASGRLLDDIERLAVATDVVVGAEDVVTPPDGAFRAYGAVPPRHRGRYILVPGAGHALYQQAPAAFAAMLEDQTETA
ncbi:alpha/beta fold hydrolase [Maritimibacter sp. HL-12]|uniref:alpha/beta fold hydrolase n=1 Tax=Maritimibacter sp. HL-12 TaxID=1162418 RepID=UPI000A0F23CC|nr:alpha/beta hydrolase [Maritimibacter sp. HL-12]SMH38253.1 Pimeloyl-ACP methyl ester carboxylesterase [Maritimibacter sp. HL-12]